MAIQDQIYTAYRAGDLSACRRILDDASPPTNQDDRHSITYWRAVLFEHENRFVDALQVLNAGRDDFNSRSLYAVMKAKLLVRLGQSGQAVAVLQSAPIVAEHETYYGLALEAAYYLCTLMIESGQRAPAELLALIPDDFITMDDHKRFVGKSDLLKTSV